MRYNRLPKQLLSLTCVFILLGILVAGLWPFHAPRNEVDWLNHGNGLHFGKYSSIVSAGQFKAPTSDGSSLEIWLKPKQVRASGTILAFYWPKTLVVPFALRQSLGDLTLQRIGRDPSRKARKVKGYVDDIFSQSSALLITITSNRAGTTVYADGVLVKRFGTLSLSSDDLSGQLIVGNSPVTTDEWSGEVRGIAVYGGELTSDQVAKHYQSWMKNDKTTLAADKRAVALYMFDEGRGNDAHNLVDSATDLIIPERFFALHEQFLERPWDEFRRDWNYWKNVGVNVAGFIPFGFFFCAYFSRTRGLQRPAAVTIALGFAVSLTIEVLQAFLPTRDSGMTDLITNTLGTAGGALLYRWTVARFNSPEATV